MLQRKHRRWLDPAPPAMPTLYSAATAAPETGACLLRVQAIIVSALPLVLIVLLLGLLLRLLCLVCRGTTRRTEQGGRRLTGRVGTARRRRRLQAGCTPCGSNPAHLHHIEQPHAPCLASTSARVLRAHTRARRAGAAVGSLLTPTTCREVITLLLHRASASCDAILGPAQWSLGLEGFSERQLARPSNDLLSICANWAMATPARPAALSAGGPWFARCGRSSRWRRARRPKACCAACRSTGIYTACSGRLHVPGLLEKLAKQTCSLAVCPSCVAAPWSLPCR